MSRQVSKEFRDSGQPHDEERHQIPSPSQTVGPFFHFGIAANAALGCMAPPETAGERIQVRFRVLDGAGDPVPDALIELWQADAAGRYVHAEEQSAAGRSGPTTTGHASDAPAPTADASGVTDGDAGISPPPAVRFCGFGRLPTDANGECVFETIRPGRLVDADGTTQAAHINICLFARGLLRHIYTRLYFEDDPALHADPVLALVPEDRRGTLIASRVGDARWSMDLRLQGEDETVFFDL